MSADWEIRQEQMFDGLFHRPSMWVTRKEYFAVVDFLDGYDTCCRHMDLRDGFHAWVKKRLGYGGGVAWPRLALRLLPGYNAEEDDAVMVFPGRELEFIEGLGKLLNEYLSDRRETGSDVDDDDQGGDA